MADEIIGNGTVQDPTGSDASALATLTKQVQANEQAFKNFAAPQDQAPAEPQAQTQATPPVQPEQAQPNKDKEGDIDPQIAKEEKVNESLKKRVEDKEARIQEILRQREELKKELYSKGQKAANLARETPPEDPNSMTEEERRFLENIEKDPDARALLKRMEVIADRRTKSLQEELALLRQETLARREAERIDSLGQAGQDWVYTHEGQRWFEDRFEEEPALKLMKDPHGAALRQFQDKLPAQARQPAAAPAVRGTPVLGVSSGTPPPVSAPPATPERTLADLSARLQEAIRDGNVAEMNRIGIEQRRAAARVQIG